jgi:hypothetical protein
LLKFRYGSLCRFRISLVNLFFDNGLWEVNAESWSRCVASFSIAPVSLEP